MVCFPVVGVVFIAVCARLVCCLFWSLLTSCPLRQQQRPARRVSITIRPTLPANSALSAFTAYQIRSMPVMSGVIRTKRGRWIANSVRKEPFRVFKAKLPASPVRAILSPDVVFHNVKSVLRLLSVLSSIVLDNAPMAKQPVSKESRSVNRRHCHR